MKFNSISIIFFLSSLLPFAKAQTMLAAGEQPQITVDEKGIVRLIFGDKEKIFYSTSMDKGSTFSKPVLVGDLSEMHLGMTRGPQLASSKDYSIVTAIDKKGNIHSFRLTHKNQKWEKIQNVNDLEASAPEGLMSIAADNENNFYAVWLDLRENRQNNICVASLNGKASWSKNKFAYKSPESHVCECCKPSVAVKNKQVSIMFRNWLNGSRDMYLVTSFNSGKTFMEAQKLGTGTWQLKGCPMDGGGLNIDFKNNIHTAWQREGQIYHAQPGKPEEQVGEGRGVGLSGDLVHWESGPDLIIKRLNGEQQMVGKGRAMKAFEFADKKILAIWEKDNQIFFKKL